jgi:hypothetical protein
MAIKSLPADELLAARVAHLNMLQGVVTRLATFSASAKNFCVTVVAALLGIAFQQHLPALLLGAAFVVLSFASLDIYYLAQERRFRDFYQIVVDRPLADAAQMDLSPPKLSLPKYLAGFRSFSTGGFYALLLIVGIALLPIVHERGEKDGLGNHRCVAGATTQSSAIPPSSGVDGGKPAEVRPKPPANSEHTQ